MTFPPLPNGRVWGSILSRTVLVGQSRWLHRELEALEPGGFPGAGGSTVGLGDAQPHQVLGLAFLS